MLLSGRSEYEILGEAPGNEKPERKSYSNMYVCMYVIPNECIVCIVRICIWHCYERKNVCMVRAMKVCMHDVRMCAIAMQIIIKKSVPGRSPNQCKPLWYVEGSDVCDVKRRGRRCQWRGSGRHNHVDGWIFHEEGGYKKKVLRRDHLPGAPEDKGVKVQRHSPWRTGNRDRQSKGKNGGCYIYELKKNPADWRDISEKIYARNSWRQIIMHILLYICMLISGGKSMNE